MGWQGEFISSRSRVINQKNIRLFAKFSSSGAQFKGGLGLSGAGVGIRRAKINKAILIGFLPKKTTSKPKWSSKSITFVSICVRHLLMVFGGCITGGFAMSGHNIK